MSTLMITLQCLLLIATDLLFLTIYQTRTKITKVILFNNLFNKIDTRARYYYPWYTGEISATET